MIRQYKIAVIGEWHLAFVTAAVLADCGHLVCLVNPQSAENSVTWSDFPSIPVTEPGLAEMIEKNIKAKRLFFENGTKPTWQAEYIWMAVDTPVNEFDVPDTLPLLNIVNQIKKAQELFKILIVSSQVPLGFGLEIEAILGKPVAYVPENLRLGSGIDTFFNADRTVIGASHAWVASEVQTILHQFKTQFITCNLVTAEMVKHANNIFLATSISFANELARVGEAYGVDSELIAKALKLDKRIGSKAYVSPGLGFAGGTLPRDLRVIQHLGKQKNIPTDLVDAVFKVNENTTAALCETIIRHIQNNKLAKSVLILGYTYKSDTNTLRRSLALDLAELLRAQSYTVMGFDPVMNEMDLNRLDEKISHCPTLEQISDGPSVIVGMTARSVFKEINWSKIRRQWGTEADKILILDTQAVFDKENVLNAKLQFKKLWEPLRNEIL